APLGWIGDHHLRQQAALGFGQVDLGAVLHRARVGVAGGEDHGGRGKGKQAQAVHSTPPMRGARTAKNVATMARTTVTTDSTRPPGMLAQASRACISALKNPVTQVASSRTKCSSEPGVRREGSRPASADTSAAPATTRPPVISQDAKLFHWISNVRA